MSRENKCDTLFFHSSQAYHLLSVLCEFLSLLVMNNIKYQRNLRTIFIYYIPKRAFTFGSPHTLSSNLFSITSIQLLSSDHRCVAEDELF